jgi:hypothetical protein
MRRIHIWYDFDFLLPILAIPVDASAQTAGGAAEPPQASSAEWGTGIGIMAVILLLIIGIGVAVKLYDVKRRRTEENAGLQSLLSEALMVEPSIAGLPVAAFVSQSVWPRSPVVIDVRGSVPTSELRDAVMRLVEREASHRHPGARTEDRMQVDPRIVQERARSSTR